GSSAPVLASRGFLFHERSSRIARVVHPMCLSALMLADRLAHCWLAGPRSGRESSSVLDDRRTQIGRDVPEDGCLPALLGHLKRPKILEVSSAPASEALSKSQVLRIEAYVGK